jgi:hypothetical protein
VADAAAATAASKTTVSNNFLNIDVSSIGLRRCVDVAGDQLGGGARGPCGLSAGELTARTVGRVSGGGPQCHTTVDSGKPGVTAGTVRSRPGSRSAPALILTGCNSHGAGPGFVSGRCPSEPTQDPSTTPRSRIRTTTPRMVRSPRACRCRGTAMRLASPLEPPRTPDRAQCRSCSPSRFLPGVISVASFRRLHRGARRERNRGRTPAARAGSCRLPRWRSR